MRLLIGIAALSLAIGGWWLYYERPYLEEQAIEKTWNESSAYDAESHSFKAHFPVPPKHVSNVLEDPQTQKTMRSEMYFAENKRGAVFMINEISYAEEIDLKINSDVLHSVVQNLVAALPNSTLDNMDMTQYKGQQAIEFTLQNNGLTTLGLAFAKDKKLYVLTVTDKNATLEPKEFKSFINLFSFNEA